MHARHLYEYAVIRIVPRVEREEFINAGIILYCASQKFLQTRYHLNPERLHALAQSPDMDELGQYLHSWERICAGGTDAGAIGALPMPSRFRWLTAARSTIVQTSRVHPGFCADARQTLDRLYDQLVA